MKKFRIAFVGFLALNVFACGIDKAKFENAYRAAKAIEGAANINVTYAQFGQLLQAYSTEVTILKDKIDTKNEQEKQIYESYAEALRAYTDSYAVWEEKIENENQMTTFAGTLSVDDITKGYWSNVKCGIKGFPATADDECARYKKYGLEVAEWKDEPMHMTEAETKQMGIKYQPPTTWYVIKEAPSVAIQQIWSYATKRIDEAQRLASN